MIETATVIGIVTAHVNRAIITINTIDIINILIVTVMRVIIMTADVIGNMIGDIKKVIPVAPPEMRNEKLIGKRRPIETSTKINIQLKIELR